MNQFKIKMKIIKIIEIIKKTINIINNNNQKKKLKLKMKNKIIKTINLINNDKIIILRRIMR